jgi:hypothetical protein
VNQGAEVIPFKREDGNHNKHISALASVKIVLFVIDPLLQERWVAHFKVDHFVKISFYHAPVATRQRTNR